MNDDARLGSLLAEYEDDGMAASVFTSAFWECRRAGPTKAADAALRMAIKQNPHIPAYLLAGCEDAGDVVRAGYAAGVPGLASVWRVPADAAGRVRAGERASDDSSVEARGTGSHLVPFARHGIGMTDPGQNGDWRPLARTPGSLQSPSHLRDRAAAWDLCFYSDR